MNYSLLVLAPSLAPIALFVIMFLGMTFFGYYNSNYVFKTKIKKELTQ